MTARVRRKGSQLAAAAVYLSAMAMAWRGEPAHGRGSQLSFSDQTAATGLISNHQPGAGMLIGLWGEISKMLSAGAVGDYNNDGLQDLYVITSGASADKLFINNGDGTFTDQAASWGIGTPHLGVGAAAGDYDNDGWLDIYVTSFGVPTLVPAAGNHKLYRNNGDNTFSNVALAAGVNHTGTVDGLGPAFGDYDLDGDLDLFIPGWLGTGNHMFRNNGNGTFTQVTAAVGLQDPPVRGFAPRFVDMDGDRWPELLLAADFGTSRYYRNNGNGTFTNITGPSGTGLDGNGMGQAVGDFNNDGLLDWYVTSIHSVNSGMPLVPGTGNMLYMCNGVHHFVEMSLWAHVNDGGWGWGTVAVDLDHDGDVDLAATNGWHQLNGNGQQEWWNEQTYLFMNNGNAVFNEEAAACGLWHTSGGRGLINFDYDEDGDQDIVIFGNSGPIRLFRNDLSGKDTNWLRVFLDSSKGASTGEPLAPNGYGARVSVTAGGVTYMRSIDGGSSYLGTCELSAHFGLGSATLVDELRVKWAKGDDTVLVSVPVNQTLTLEPPGAFVPCAGDVLPGDGQVNVTDLLAIITAWGPCPVPPATCPADISPPGPGGGDGEVNVGDLLLVINGWGPCP